MHQITHHLQFFVHTSWDSPQIFTEHLQNMYLNVFVFFFSTKCLILGTCTEGRTSVQTQ